MRGEIFAVELARQQSVNRQQLKWNRYMAVKRIVRRILAGDQDVCMPILSKEDWTVFGMFYGITRSPSSARMSNLGHRYPPAFITRPNCPIHWSLVYRKGRSSAPWKNEDDAYAEHTKDEIPTGHDSAPRIMTPKSVVLLKYGYTTGMFFHINPSITSKVLRG
ncbi:hypothetical protein F418_p42 [Hafnia phage Enc34]|uniref:Uncharacterized protein n=1 Tax=Hafnia phage Enc34 TaxID=1150990 RepID=H6WYK4_9CAUD|nr:hypothetical protein F418_p42 [Hafnia phage Enc34]AFB84059.1 hypothetical protein [Hafnia phage Enc34]